MKTCIITFVVIVCSVSLLSLLSRPDQRGQRVMISHNIDHCKIALLHKRQYHYDALESTSHVIPDHLYT